MEQFDLSKLKRRQPDMKSISAPRFKFPGWKLVDAKTWEVIPESKFGEADPDTIWITLPRNPRWATLTIKHGVEGWYLEAGCLHYGRHTVWVTDGDFQTIVNAAENYILRAVSRNDYHVIRNGSDDREFRNFAIFASYVDKLMSIWRETANED